MSNGSPANYSQPTRPSAPAQVIPQRIPDPTPTPEPLKEVPRNQLDRAGLEELEARSRQLRDQYREMYATVEGMNAEKDETMAVFDKCGSLLSRWGRTLITELVCYHSISWLEGGLNYSRVCFKAFHQYLITVMFMFVLKDVD